MDQKSSIFEGWMDFLSNQRLLLYLLFCNILARVFGQSVKLKHFCLFFELSSSQTILQIVCQSLYLKHVYVLKVINCNFDGQEQRTKTLEILNN